MPKWLENFDGRVEIASPVTQEQLKAVPARRGVMLLTGADDRPIVMITAADMRARLSSRLRAGVQQGPSRTADLAEITRQVCWKVTTGHFETDFLFYELGASMPGFRRSQLAWKPAWFVHLDTEDEFPQFSASREVFSRRGRYLGPFPDGRSARRYVSAIVDAFDLCRDYKRLRLSPRGQRCSYAQMGRCLCACDGTVPMERYRQAVSEAADFAAGRLRARREELARQMKQAATKLQFERAIKLKSRIELLSALEGPAFEHLADARDFQFLMVQPGRSPRQAKVFLVDRGAITPASPLDYPLKTHQLQRALKQMSAHVARGRQVGRDDVWRMGLVSHYLFSSRQRRGLILRWRADLEAQELERAVESSVEELHLKAPAARKAKASRPGSGRQEGKAEGTERSPQAQSRQGRAEG